MEQVLRDLILNEDSSGLRLSFSSDHNKWLELLDNYMKLMSYLYLLMRLSVVSQHMYAMRSDGIQPRLLFPLFLSTLWSFTLVHSQ